MSRVKDNLFTSVPSSGGNENDNPGSGGGSSTNVITDAENVVISDTEPLEPTASTIWLDTSNGSNLLKVYDGSKWIAVSGAWA